jgi:hypothetical protein
MVQNSRFYGNFVSMEEKRKKFKDTKVGEWLSKNAPKVLDVVGDALPDKGVLGVIKNIIDGDPDLTIEQKMEYEKLQNDFLIQQEQQISDRWKYDMSSDSWLSKNVRPLTVSALILFLFILIFLDALEIKFIVKESWISLYETILITAIGGYFVVRSVDKKVKI